MFELHHKNAGLIFSFFHPLQKARDEFHSGNFRKTYLISDKFQKEFNNDKNYSDLFRKTDGKAYNDKQLELLYLGISQTNASYSFITRYHVNAVLGLLINGINIHSINAKFIEIQTAEWYQLDLMSIGLSITSSLTVTRLDNYRSIIDKFDQGLHITQAYNEVLEQSLRPTMRTR